MHLRYAFLLLATMSLCILSACKQKLDRQQTGYILGPTNDIVAFKKKADKASTVLDFNQAVYATALIFTQDSDKARFCTGTLIQPEAQAEPWIVTNRHCFIDKSNPDKVLDEGSQQKRCEQLKVYFGLLERHQEGTQELFETGCLEKTLQLDETGDLAAFRLTETPPKAIPFQLDLQHENSAEHLALVLHYPSVQEHFVSVEGIDYSLPYLAQTTHDCVTKGTFTPAEQALDPSLRFAIRHTCDIIDGSSGSALISAETHKIIGINWGGIKFTNNASVTSDNVATRASYLAAFLEKRLDTFKQEFKLASDSENVATNKKNSAMIQKCGVIGGMANPITQFWQILVLLLAFLPALFGFGTSKSAQAAPLQKHAAWSSGYLYSYLHVVQQQLLPGTDNAKSDVKKEKSEKTAQTLSEDQLRSLKDLAEKQQYKLVLAQSHFDKLGQIKQTGPSNVTTVASTAALASLKGSEFFAYGKPACDSMEKSQHTTWCNTLKNLETACFKKTCPTDELSSYIQQMLSHPDLDISIETKVLASISYLALEDYASALRVLYELQKVQSHFRAAYEMTQRIYSAKQRGAGAVGIGINL